MNNNKVKSPLVHSKEENKVHVSENEIDGINYLQNVAFRIDQSVLRSYHNNFSTILLGFIKDTFKNDDLYKVIL